MTHDPMQHGGRTQEQVKRNSDCVEVIVDAMVILLCLSSICYLVALVMGWVPNG